MNQYFFLSPKSILYSIEFCLILSTNWPFLFPSYISSSSHVVCKRAVESSIFSGGGLPASWDWYFPWCLTLLFSFFRLSGLAHMINAIADINIPLLLIPLIINPFLTAANITQPEESTYTDFLAARMQIFFWCGSKLLLYFLGLIFILLHRIVWLPHWNYVFSPSSHLWITCAALPLGQPWWSPFPALCPGFRICQFLLNFCCRSPQFWSTCWVRVFANVWNEWKLFEIWNESPLPQKWRLASPTSLRPGDLSFLLPHFHFAFIWLYTVVEFQTISPERCFYHEFVYFWKGEKQNDPMFPKYFEATLNLRDCSTGVAGNERKMLGN